MRKQFRQAAAYLGGFHVSTLAASASFFIILSIFPLLTLVLTLLRYLPVTLQDFLDMLTYVLPEALMEVAEDLLRELYTANLAAVVSVTVLVALWSASRGVYGILLGLSAIQGDTEHRSYLRRRLMALFYTFLLIIALFVTLGLQVFGDNLLALSYRVDFWLLEAVAQLVHQRYVVTTALLALLFSLIFAFFPARRLPLRHVLLPALATAVGWLVFSYFFSIYVTYGTFRFDGSMTMLVLGMLWLYICMCILFYGGVLCRLSVEGQLGWKAAKNFFFPR